MELLNPLLVPIEVKALVVNNQVRIGQNFQRWQMNYHNLDSFTSPEPPPFSGNANDFSQNPANNGVYLHWSLPEALRHGVQDNTTGQTTYPLVPNRWLVVRYSGPLAARVATAWVVESDYVDPNHGTAPFIDPFITNRYQVTTIGRRLAAADWQETNQNPLFLQAVGPGNLTFAAYQPYAENVFSIHDPLTDGAVADVDTLSYLVMGWYSNPADDILAQWQSGTDFTTYLQSLHWTLAVPIEAEATQSVYEGMVNGVQWNLTGPIPVSDRTTDPKTVKVAIGNTAIDALTALIHAQLDANGNPNGLDADLLEAFQYDLVRVLDQPDGHARLVQLIHQAWFSSLQGGYQWEIVDNPANPDGTPPPSETELQAEAAWLDQLNKDQAVFDAGMRTLGTQQWQLYAVWWKQGKAHYLGTLNQYPDGVTPQQFTQALDPTSATSLVTQVKNALVQLGRQVSDNVIPFADNQDDLATRIAAYAAAHSLPATRVLRQSAQTPFYQAADPVLLLAGTRVNDMLVDADALPCRFSTQTVTGFTYQSSPITTQSLHGGIPTTPLGAVPTVANALMVECFFVDATNATMVAQDALGSSDPAVIASVGQAMADPSASIGTRPALDMAPWQQPWAPLFLMWEVQYYPIAYGTTGAPNWTFTGSTYEWTGTGAAPTPIPFSGRIFLTPQTSFNFRARLEQWLAHNPDADIAQLEAFIASIDDWDFLSQSLDGLSQQMRMLDPLGNLAPDDSTVLYTQPQTLTLADLVGSQATYVPAPGIAQQPPFQPWPPSNFQQWRAGQFYFSRLLVVDRFGQSIEVANSTTQQFLSPITSPDLTPTRTVIPNEPGRFVQLPPRLLQPARLDFDYVSAANDQQIVDLNADVNPVVAWVMLNYLDQSLACYDRAGVALGEIWLVINDQQQQQVQWVPAPGSAYRTVADLLADPELLHLGQMIQGLQTAGVSAFTELLRVIDASLWCIDPAGQTGDRSLSLLIGRPLALTRVRLQYRLMGPPITDQSWRYTFAEPASAFVNYAFPIALGREDQTQDGLIGYFANNDYAHFNSVHFPTLPFDQPSGYIDWIGQNGNYVSLTLADTSAAYLTMLADPQAAVQAFTAVLPVTPLDLPARFSTVALDNVQVQFRMGPVLTDVQTAVDDSVEPAVSTTSIVLPQPSEKHGTWSWLQYLDSTTPVAMDVISPDERARFPNVPSRLREGLLTLTTNLAAQGGD